MQPISFAQYDRRIARCGSIMNCYGVLRKVTACADGTFRRARGNSPGLPHGESMATHKHILIVDEDREARAALAPQLERPAIA